MELEKSRLAESQGKIRKNGIASQKLNVTSSVIPGLTAELLIYKYTNLFYSWKSSIDDVLLRFIPHFLFSGRLVYCKVVVFFKQLSTNSSAEDMKVSWESFKIVTAPLFTRGRHKGQLDMFDSSDLLFKKKKERKKQKTLSLCYSNGSSHIHRARTILVLVLTRYASQECTNCW